MSKKQFWARLSLYVVFGAIIPVSFLTWRFKLFEVVQETTSKVTIGGWGLIAILFIAFFFIKLMKAIRKGMPFSIGRQILDGFSKTIIPLIVAAVCVYMMKDLMKELFQFLCVVIFCEMVAVCVNPLPQWAHENHIEYHENTMKNFLTTLGIVGEKK